MKSVLISIQRPHTDNIKALIKKIEVRKNKPNQETPFPCFIYETKTKGGCGKVIGEFMCDRIVGYYPYGLRGFELSNEVLKNMCLSNKDLNEYGKLDRVYGWHISDLKIYDKPKELREFYNSKRQPIQRAFQSWGYCYEKEN